MITKLITKHFILSATILYLVNRKYAVIIVKLYLKNLGYTL